MHILADLCAGTDGGPGIHHGVFFNPRAEIHEGRHQHHIARDISRTAHHSARHHPESCLTEAVLAPAFKLQRHLVISAGRNIHRRGIRQAEGHQHRLFQPLIDLPAAITIRLRHPGLPGIEHFQRFLHRSAISAGGGGGKLVAPFPKRFDAGLKGGHGHGAVSSGKAAFPCGAARALSTPESNERLAKQADDAACEAFTKSARQIRPHAAWPKPLRPRDLSGHERYGRESAALGTR